MQIKDSSPVERYKISQFNEPYLQSINRSTFEKSSAKNTFDSFFKEKLWDENYLYVILGSDSGLLVDYIIEHGLPYDSRYIIIDLPDVLQSIESQLTFTKWDEKVALCTPDSWQEVAEEFKLLSYLFREKVRYLKSLAAVDGFEPLYYQIDTQISLELESIKHKTSVSLSRKPFVTRQIENLSENSIPAQILKDKFNNKTCVILGGGPSLDDNINWVKENQEDIIVIAVSRIANKLLHEGILPHIVLSVDPHDVSFDVSKEMLDLPDSVLFLHSNFCAPKLTAQWHGKSLYFGKHAPWKSKTNQENILLSGPTVTNAAIAAAIEFGFKQILLTGVDLCYASDGKTYASGSNESKVGPVLGIKGQWVETYSGQLAETSTPFLHASYILAEQAESAKKRGCQLINLSANAAKVEYIKHTPQQDIIFEKQGSIAQILALVPSLTPQELNQKNNAILKEISDLNKELNEINAIAKQALIDNNALYQKYANEEKNRKIKLKIDKAEKKLTTRFGDTTTFIKTFGIEHFIKTVRTDSEEEWSDEQMEETGRLYYQAFIDTITSLKPLINDAKTRIKYRIEEEKKSPNIDTLLSHWQQEALFGRASNWRHNHSEQFNELSVDIQHQFDTFEINHRQIIENLDTAHYRRSQNEASLKGLNRKAAYLFQTNNLSGLSKLTTGLKTLGDKDEDAKWQYNVANGYLLSLEDEKSNALAAFEHIESSKLTENERLQIAKLALELNQSNKAEQKLKELAEISDSYMPNYAHILKLHGKLELALETYNAYLENNNSDIKVWLVLGKLYLELDAPDIATIAFNQVLELDPQNVDANHLLTQIN